MIGRLPTIGQPMKSQVPGISGLVVVPMNSGPRPEVPKGSTMSYTWVMV